jgi:hypothetical protein
LKLARALVGKEYAERLQAGYNLKRVKVEGKSGKHSIPRCPAYLKAEFDEKRERIASHSKESQVMRDYEAHIIKAIKEERAIACAHPRCSGLTFGEVEVRDWDSYMNLHVYSFSCPRCGAGYETSKQVAKTQKVEAVA